MKEGLLFPLSEWTCFLCPSSVVSAVLLSAIDDEHNEHFLISLLQHDAIVTNVKERK